MAHCARDSAQFHEEGAWALANLSADVRNALPIVDAGALPVLFRLVQSDSPSVQLQASALPLRPLRRGQGGRVSAPRALLAASFADFSPSLPPFRRGRPPAPPPGQTPCAQATWVFANLSVVDELKPRIGSHDKFVPTLYARLDATRDKADAHRPLRLQTIRTLANLAVDTTNRARVAAGLAVAIDALVGSSRDEITQATLRLMVNLSYDAQIAIAMLQEPRLIAALLENCASPIEPIQQEVRFARRLRARPAHPARPARALGVFLVGACRQSRRSEWAAALVSRVLTVCVLLRRRCIGAAPCVRVCRAGRAVHRQPLARRGLRGDARLRRRAAAARRHLALRIASAAGAGVLARMHGSACGSAPPWRGGRGEGPRIAPRTAHARTQTWWQRSAPVVARVPLRASRAVLTAPPVSRAWHRALSRAALCDRRRGRCPT